MTPARPGPERAGFSSGTFVAMGCVGRMVAGGLIASMAVAGCTSSERASVDQTGVPATAIDENGPTATTDMASTSTPPTTRAPTPCVVAPSSEECRRPGAGRSVRLGRGSWSTGFLQAQIVRDLLEELGYRVEDPARFEHNAFDAYRLLALGDIDLFANSWYPAHRDWLEAELDDGSPIAESVSRFDEPMIDGGGLQGWLVTKSWVDEHGITTMDQINRDPALHGALDTDGDGRGEFFGCPMEWSCDDVMTSQIVFAEWTNLEQVVACSTQNSSSGCADGFETYVDLFDEFLRRVGAGEPAIAYVWTPTSFLSRARPGVDTMWLSVEEASVHDDSNPLGYESGRYSQRHEDGTIGFTDLDPSVCLQGPDGCQLGWLGSHIEITINRGFAAAEPAAVRLLEQIRLDRVDLSERLLALEGSDGPFLNDGERRAPTASELDAASADWIDDNRAQVESWLDAARSIGP